MLTKFWTKEWKLSSLISFSVKNVRLIRSEVNKRHLAIKLMLMIWVKIVVIDCVSKTGYKFNIPCGF